MATMTEEERLAQLRALDVNELRDDGRVTTLLEAAAVILRAPIVRIQVIEADEQICVAGVGSGLPERTPREDSICTCTIEQGEDLVIPDLADSVRFHDHPAYTRPPHIRFYAGVPLLASGGAALGTLCAMDFVPRLFPETERQRLLALSRVAGAFVTGHRRETGHHEARAQDQRTGMLGRDHLKRRVETALRAARDEEPPAPVTLVLLRLEDVVTLCGAGDTERGEALLHAAAERVAAALPVQAESGEWNTDELLIWAPASYDGCDPDTLARTVSDAVAAPVEVVGRSFRPMAAIGVLRAPDDGETLSELASLARQLTQRAQGDRRVRFARQALGRVDLVRQVDLAQRLDDALEAGCIEPHFQPRVSLQTGSVTGMEALARWHDQQLGWISPGEFVPVAERTGRIAELGDAMLDRTCAHLRDWLDRGLDPAPVAVNLSPEELRDADFVARIRAHLARHDVSGARLELEITERGFSTDLDAVAASMAALGDDGVRFAVDDFGTGYCSLIYLQRLPTHYVKIDRGFVSGIDRQVATGGLVEAIVGMSRALTMLTIAEGVETADEREALKRHGVDHAQGFFHYHPMPASAAQRLLDAG